MSISLDEGRTPFARAAAEGLVGGGNTFTDIPNNPSAESVGWVGLSRRRRGRPRTGETDWAPAFIEELVRGNSVRGACRAIGIDGTTPYERRKRDEVFRAAWDEACTVATPMLEAEAARRAYHGTVRGVYYKGARVGTERRYSDLLLIFLLKARKPEMYRDTVEDGLTKPTTINVTVVNVDAPPTALTSPPLLEVIPTPTVTGVPSAPVPCQVPEGDGMEGGAHTG